MSAINEQDFLDPISRRLARGEAVAANAQLWLDPKGRETVSLTNGGMVDPVRHDLVSGTTIYRFASESDGVEGAMRGGWWVERRELDQLIRYAKLNNKTLGYAVRALCGVPPEWGSALNFLIAVKTAGVVATWRGLAASAHAVFTPPPGMSRAASSVTTIPAKNDVAALRVPQLFIPGTRKDGATRAFFQFEAQWQTEGARDWIYGSG